MLKRLPTEFAINMNLHKMLILQQSELENIDQYNYFDEHDPCHLYFICKRPRLSLNKSKFYCTKEFICFVVNVHKGFETEEIEIKFENTFETDELILQTEFPFNIFQIISKGEVLVDAKLSPFLQVYTDFDFLDLEVLYIGQSYGVDGSRKATDRLKSHSTLQGIYSEAIARNPDSEIWIALATFAQINITMMDGRTKFSKDELKLDKERLKTVGTKLNYEGINEQQRINFTEAALIKYFQPSYNVIYKDSFPNPAHSTYSECYDLDINSICIELHTKDMINCRMYSESVPRRAWHMKKFLLHSPEERKSIFDIA